MSIEFKYGEKLKSPLYRKLRSVQRDMKKRCYNENCRAYKYYGARGVKVCEDWLSISGFLRTVDSVDVWDVDKFLKGELYLDKDIKVIGNKLYSPETCKFVSNIENQGYRPTSSRTVKGISPDNKTHIFTNQAEFCRINGLDRQGMNKALREGKEFNGWFFSYEDTSNT